MRVGRALAPTAATGALAVGLAGVVALARAPEAVRYAQLHTSFVAGAGALALLGATLAVGLVLALPVRRAER
jgi:hypothetical protein